MYNLSKYIITLLGIGFISKAPGTIGSFFSIIFFYILIDVFTQVTSVIFFIITLFIAKKCIDIYQYNNKKHDSSEIVIDEFLGINFILIFYDLFKFSNDLVMFFLIFIIFRIFDIIKIYPANWIDSNIKNSWGVILDDIIAGIYTILILIFLHALI